MARPSILLVLAVGITSACERGDQRDGASAIVSDSAGVEIVESFAPHWTDETRWLLEDQPIVDLGASETDTTQQFTMLRGVHRASDGSIAVFDVGSASIHYFDTRGALVARVGREGRGPGEFPRRSGASWFPCGGDTVLVAIQNRISLYAVPGEYVREFTLGAVEGVAVSPVACLYNRLLVMYQSHPRRDTEGLHRDSVGLAWMDLSGGLRFVLDTVGHWDRWYGRTSEGYGSGQAPFGRTLSVAIRDGVVALTMGDRFEIEIRDTMGVLRRLARVTGRDEPVSSRDIQRFREIVVPILARYGDDATVLDRQLSQELLPETKPSIAALQLDAAGNLWARAYDMTDATAFYELRPDRPAPIREPNRRWTVLDSTGRLLGDIALPPRFDVHEIGHDWVLGVWRDSLDVEHVQLYRLRKPAT